MAVNLQKLRDMKKGVDYIGVGTGAMVFNRDGKVLIGKRGIEAGNERGKWEFPGGSVEYGETCAEAIVREIREEAGIEIVVFELLEVVDHILRVEGQHWVAISYIAKLAFGIPQVLEPVKIEAFLWVDLNEAENYELTLASQQNLKAFREKYGNQLPATLF